MFKFIQLVFLLRQNTNIIKGLSEQDSPSFFALIKRSYEITKALNLYRKEHPTCAWCDTNKKIEVHHIVPLWSNILLGADPNNFISLCRKCHFTVGHNGNFSKRYTEDIKTLCENKKIFIKKP